jgi:ABC-type transporter Mla MlaB component
MSNQENDEVGRLLLDGACTLRTVDDTYARLSEMSARHAVLEIDCSGVDEVDLSFIQLLLAARSSARRSGRTVRLAQSASGALRDALERGGFLADGAGQADRTFWLQSEIA